MDGEPRWLRKLATKEALRLLGGVQPGAGGVLVARDAGDPAGQPRRRQRRGDHPYHLGVAVLSSVGMVVAYEADAIDSETRLGWTVVVTGFARHVRHPEETSRYELLLRPWVAGEMDHWIRIQPEAITGYELVDGEALGSASA